MNSSVSVKVLLLLSIVISQSTGTRVCKSWQDYPNPTSDNCYDNPDGAPANVTQILQRWGCTTEEHQLLTQDGFYILVVYAVMGPPTNLTPILMLHGIRMNSLAFVTMYNKTIAYQLLQKGHPLFFINFRGTRYSTGHKNLTQNDEAYWKFSLHHLAIYDLPAALDLIAIKYEGRKTIIICYSMGTSVANIYAITYPEVAKSKLLGIIEMAAIANFTASTSAVWMFAPWWPVWEPIANEMWHGQLFPIKEQNETYCSSTLLGMMACSTINACMFGAHYSMLDPCYLPISMSQNRDSVCSMLAKHYIQIHDCKQFQNFDFGPAGNLIVYGTVYPPIYNFSKMTVPVALLQGRNDILSTLENAAALYENFPLEVRCGFIIIADTEWPHNGFMISKNMPEYLHGHVFILIDIMVNGTCKLTSSNSTSSNSTSSYFTSTNLPSI